MQYQTLSTDQCGAVSVSMWRLGIREIGRIYTASIFYWQLLTALCGSYLAGKSWSTDRVHKEAGCSRLLCTATSTREAAINNQLRDPSGRAAVRRVMDRTRYLCSSLWRRRCLILFAARVGGKGGKDGKYVCCRPFLTLLYFHKHITKEIYISNIFSLVPQKSIWTIN